ncbi:MAG: AAA family ATPase [Candidatus Omnitrophica bacterium]|nr:AAA family ATPase [Candidatus Omnitrophota bacterium]MCM8826676.1 AAA family ATPase [Candidatus Omnitrophota bacterium]
MYEKFYGLNEKPFNVTPDTKFFFPSEKHEEALNSLIFAIIERKGFVVITGEIGSGKTTVWHVLLKRLVRGTKIALITNTHLTPKQIIMAILDEFEVPFKDNASKIKLMSLLNKFLIEQISLGINVVVIIDEAQNLSISALEEVRMLSNLETEKEKLIQVILLGQPELRDKLKKKEMEQLRQRIAVYYHILPLDKEETKNYINHRLKLAGANGKVIFDNEAVEKIYFYSRGTPRKINTLCDRALLTGFIKEATIINKYIVDESASDIGI